MNHQDGRCATDAETIYVHAQGCSAGMGTSTAPICSPQDAAALFTGARRLVLLRGGVDRFAWSLTGPQVTVVGQGAVIAGGNFPGVRISGGDAYLRGFSVAGGLGLNGVGLIIDSGATVRMDGLSVLNNAGGGVLVDGARFEIRNTTVAGNGPGKFGGILVQGVASGGPAKLERVSVKDNKAPGITCSTQIQGAGVFATGNPVVDIDPACMVTPCSPVGPTCGAP
jgi:hypothetical protein